MQRKTRPQGRNPVIWRKATVEEIAEGERRAQNEHVHNYYQHCTLRTHMQCACGWLVKNNDAPADLIFIGPARPR